MEANRITDHTGKNSKRSASETNPSQRSINVGNSPRAAVMICLSDESPSMQMRGRRRDEKQDEEESDLADAK
jgi:hypothetical protein